MSDTLARIRRLELWAWGTGNPPAHLPALPDLGMSQWQDISTAPKDGTHILVGAPFRKFEAQPGYVVARDSEPAFVAEACWGRSWSDATNRWIAPHSDQDEQGGCHEYDPTHWMPLPTPPGAKS